MAAVGGRGRAEGDRVVVVVRGMVAAEDMVAVVAGMVAAGDTEAAGTGRGSLLRNLGNHSPFLYLSNKFRNKNCNISVR